MTGIPNGWAQEKLGSIVQPRGEKAAPRDFPTHRFLGMDHVEPNTRRIVGSVPAGSMLSTAVRFYPGDVLYGRLRPYLNKVAHPDFEGLASAEFIVLPANEMMLSKFLAYRLNASDFVNFASHLDEGDRPRVSFDQISEFPIMVPPANEQRRIVAKLEELFSELEAGIENLKAARKRLKLYRQALLQHAFEGKLTAKWREQSPLGAETAEILLEHILIQRRMNWESERLSIFAAARKIPPKDWRSRYSDPAVADTAELPTLPAGWKWVSLDALTNGLRGGTTEKPVDSQTTRPVLRSSSVRQGSLNINDVNYLPDTHSATMAFLVRDGDLLITRLSGSLEYVGNCAVVRNLGDRLVWFPDRLFSARPVFPALGRLIEIAFGSEYSRQRIRREAMSSAGHQRIAIRNLVGHPIPLPPAAEQSIILDEIERRLSVADAVFADIEGQLEASEVLRQSILKRAFSGQLVPQDPDDEPASVLLERIRAEKVAAGGDKPARGRRGRRSIKEPATPSPGGSHAEGDQMTLGEGALFE